MYISTLPSTSALDGGVGGQPQAPAALPLEKDPVPIVQEAGWASGPFWTDAKNLAPTGIRSPDRSARSESLYRLSYPVPYRVHKSPPILLTLNQTHLFPRRVILFLYGPF